MPVKTDYDRDFIFDIDAYLIDNYPSMTMTIRRSVCAMALEELDSQELEIIVDGNERRANGRGRTHRARNG